MKDEEKNVDTESAEETEQMVDDQEVSEETAPEEEVEKTVEQERDEYLAGWQRAQADLQNLKKRHDEERAVFTGLGKESLLRDLVPMMDNFDAAFSNKEVWESVDQNWRVGIEYIHGQFTETLANNGIETIGSVGDTFDATIHDPVESHGDDQTISEVRQKGYKMGDKIIRPAKVVLGKA